ncbi:MAG: DNA mismatch repair endonuclease MutL, partial [Gemmatimonadales bacterium]
LVGVTTFGFRGEALPSIATVSRLELVTSEPEAEGTRLAVTGGRLETVEQAVRQRGTTVTVRTLFFNTPARRKFLRSVSSESRAAAEVVATLALAHPAVGIELSIDGRSRLTVPPGQDLTARLAGVWGRDLAGGMLPVSYAAGQVRVSGFVQRPADTAPTGRRTQLFVNGRPFRDSFLVRAAEAGYRSAIAPGDRPSMLLMLEVPRDEVDVNVHPAKLEVRFRDRFGVERVLEEAVRDSLGALIAAVPLGDWRPMPVGIQSGPAAPAPLVEADLWRPPEAGESDGPDSGPVTAMPEVPAFPLVQLFDTYIAYETADALVIVDQHSAHERVLYEDVMASLSGPGLPGQRLLLPATVDLTDEELEVVEASREALERVGFEVQPFGGRTVALQSVPNPHPRFDAVQCFREMVADLARGRFGGWANRLERFAATYACRAAVKAGQRLDGREMRELITRLMATTLPPHDVHGRATIVQLPREELERRFGRR